MAESVGPEPVTVVLKFGGGVHSRAPADEIHDRECTEGQNFLIDAQNTQFAPRPPFDLVGTVPNGEEVRGFINLRKRDGTVSLCVQAGDTVYKWTGSNFVSVTTVESTAKLRGRIEHIWELGDKVLVTDINLADVVMEWDGSTLSDVSFTDEDGNAFGDFKAKYCLIENERAIFSNVIDSTPTTLPHMMVGAKVSDYTQITVANKPSSALGDDDPFYLLSPDVKTINGAVAAFNEVVVSTEYGNIYRLIGSSAKDYSFKPLYPNSGASGDEAVAHIGNDVAYGRQGRIESLISSDKYADVETDDLSSPIYDLVEDFADWTIVYNQRTSRVYCYPYNQAEMWTLYKPLIGSQVSPWTRYVTNHSMQFNPTAMMNAYDPVDKLEYVWMGDDSGNVYRMEGTGAGDGGINDVTVQRLSKTVLLPDNTEAFDISGWVRYRKIAAATLALKFEFQGDHIHTDTVEVDLDAATGNSYYGGGTYYSDGSVYGSNVRKFHIKNFPVAGSSTEFQVRATVETKEEFAISEIGLRFTAETATDA